MRGLLRAVLPKNVCADAQTAALREAVEEKKYPEGVGEITPFMMAVELGDMDEVSLWVGKYKKDVNSAKLNGETALMMASWKGYYKIAEYLIEHGADVNAKNDRGATSIAFAKKRGHLKIVELLRKHGAKE